MSPAKTAEPMKMPFGMLIRVGPGNHVLDGVQIHPRESLMLTGERAHCKVYGLSAVETRLNPNRSRCRLESGLTRVGWIKNNNIRLQRVSVLQ